MSDAPRFASPPCLACEMDEAYAGYLPKAELAAALARLAALAEGLPEPERTRWIAGLQPLLPPEPQLPAAAEKDAPTGPADHPGAAVRALLPRIADDGIHARLKRLVEELAPQP